MGFFNKLFGESKKEQIKQPIVVKKIRASYKSEEYFKRYLDKKNKEIMSFLKILEDLLRQNKVIPFNYWAIAMRYISKLYASYSLGCNIKECYGYYINAVEYYQKGWSEEAIYSDMIEMVSLGVLLDIPNTYFERVVDYVEKTDRNSSYEEWFPDALLWYMINFKTNGKAVAEKVLLADPYQNIFDLTKLPKEEAESGMKKYLEKWYSTCKDDPWYDTHKKPGLAYKGYWCWESGAITKIMGLDDSSYKDSPYYPYDMVHPEGGGKMYTDFNVLDV